MTAFLDAYAGTELILPNGERCRCRTLTVADAALLFRLCGRVRRGEGAAYLDLMLVFPSMIDAEAAMAQLTQGEVMAVLGFLLSGPVEEGPKRNRQREPNLDDLLAEYVYTYKCLPSPETPWPVVRELTARAAVFDVRSKLVTAEGTALGASRALAGKESGQLQAAMNRLSKVSYPLWGGHGA